MLDGLQRGLSEILGCHPDPDGGDFWMAFAERSVAIEGRAGPEDRAHVRARLDSILGAEGVIVAKQGAVADCP
jgi:hypothetical protein